MLKSASGVSSVKIKMSSFLISVMFVVTLFSGCAVDSLGSSEEKKPQNEFELFGIDLNLLNPIVIWAKNSETEETAFSRDPSNISAVIKMMERIKRKKAEEPSGAPKGILFVMSTLYGDFHFGISDADKLWVDGVEYTLDRDYSSEMLRLFKLIQSESDFVGIVERKRLDSITADMTYKELVTLFGLTKETTVLSGGRAFLYQYNGYEFYISYQKETDLIDFTSDELIKEIFYNHNLAFDPLVRKKITFSYELLYDKTLSTMVDEFTSRNKSVKLEQIVVDSTQWLGVTQERAVAIKNRLIDNYDVEVVDTTSLNAIMKDEIDFKSEIRSKSLVINAEYFSYISEEKANFTMRARYVEKEENSFNKNFILEKKDGSWIESN